MSKEQVNRNNKRACQLRNVARKKEARQRKIKEPRMTLQRRCMSVDTSGDEEATKDGSEGLEDEKQRDGEVTVIAEEEAGILSMNNSLQKEKLSQQKLMARKKMQSKIALMKEGIPQMARSQGQRK